MVDETDTLCVCVCVCVCVRTILFRYIYVPLGGSHSGVFRKVLSTALAFGFVCFWHGGHDYLQQWALLNWAGVLLENALSTLLTSAPLRTLIVSPSLQMCLFSFLLCTSATSASQRPQLHLYTILNHHCFNFIVSRTASKTNKCA